MTSAPLRSPDASVPADIPTAIFRTQRIDRRSGEPMRWKIPVEPGPYVVRLYFMEASVEKGDARVFDVVAEGGLALDDLDIFAEAGRFRPLSKTVTLQSDHHIDIRFRSEVGRPSIAGIEILTAADQPQLEGREGRGDPLCHGIAVGADDDLASIASASPAGTQFCLESGIHRFSSPVQPKSGQSFIGMPGAVLSGARLVQSWDRRGDVWVASGQSQESRPHGRCIEGLACQYNEDVFVDGVVAERVMNPSELTGGRYYFDYSRDEIHIADDPASHRIEAAVSPFAFKGRTGVDDVRVEELIIEHFANAAQKGTVYPNGGIAWRARNNEVRWNHGTGLSAATGGEIVGNIVHHNGQKGLGGVGNGILVENNEVAHNNTLGFAPGWEAGGAKFARTKGLIVRNNYVHHNDGNGLWSDVDSLDSIYEQNVVIDNSGQGIMYEISYAAIIRNNVVKRNGFGRAGGNWMYGAGILIAHSGGVSVYGNTVEDNYNGIAGIQQDRGGGTFGDHLLVDLVVRDNIIRMPRGKSGIAQTVGNPDLFTDAGNRFKGNTYYLMSPRSFAWMDSTRTPAEWKAFGNDIHGAFRLY
jgi:parallel beta helix pectate lyase-like protein/malectin (di-glucose binding ER protein)